MKILALELSSARGSVAWRDGDLEWARQWPNNRKNSGEFFQNLADAQKQFGPPARIVVGLGPGSYAGTRIAISTAIGLQLATKAELVGLSSLCAVECDAPAYAVVGDARRQSFFLAQVRDRIVSVPPALQSEAALRSALAALNDQVPVFAMEELRQFDGVPVRYPSAEILARLAAERNREFVQPPLEPIYLREPHITIPRQR
ncbi:MAG TPA: tRNA (adenosine(37)-N6)-threonylcarbamoyltransferase complex dimerization subunit type 1 TsaB [Chthoniobacterales bacterium]|nr:tRNA (adenosine(37)-N6)-threonylcarbamoyltransferase complex dimerization subunit type 1 TsaB [Chthoniobacterales bacterium]